MPGYTIPAFRYQSRHFLGYRAFRRFVVDCVFSAWLDLQKFQGCLTKICLPITRLRSREFVLGILGILVILGFVPEPVRRHQSRTLPPRRDELHSRGYPHPLKLFRLTSTIRQAPPTRPTERSCEHRALHYHPASTGALRPVGRTEYLTGRATLNWLRTTSSVPHVEAGIPPDGCMKDHDLGQRHGWKQPQDTAIHNSRRETLHPGGIPGQLFPIPQHP